MLYKQAVLWGISNKDTKDPAYRPRGIEVKKIEDDENSWEDAVLGMDAKTAWSGIYYDPQPNITYQYKAFVTIGPNENRERIYGSVKTFTYNNFLDTYQFAFSANPPEGGTVTGYINDEEVASPFSVGEDVDNPSSWKVEQTPNEDYEFNHFAIYDESTSSSFEDTVEGLMNSNVNVVAFYDKKESGSGTDFEKANIEIRVVVDTYTAQTYPYSNYITVANANYPVPIGAEWSFNPIAKPGYEVQGWTLNSLTTELILGDDINFLVQGNTIVYVWVKTVDSFAVYVNANPSTAANMFVNGTAVANTQYLSFPRSHSEPITITYSIVDSTSYTFKQWREGNEIKDGDPNVYTYTIPSDPNITAVYIWADFEKTQEPSTITITIAPKPNGSGTITAPSAADENIYASYASGNQVTPPWTLEYDLLATPKTNDGWKFTNWSIGLNPICEETILPKNIFNSFNQNTAIYANFERSKCVLTFITDVENITVNPSQREVDYNTSINKNYFSGFTLQGTGSSNYRIGKWIDENEEEVTNTSITIKSDKTFTAKLVAKPQVKFKHATKHWTSDPYSAFDDVYECKNFSETIDGTTLAVWDSGGETQNDEYVYIPGAYQANEYYINTYLYVPEGFTFEVYQWGNNGWLPTSQLSGDQFVKTPGGPDDEYILTRTDNDTMYVIYGIKLIEAQ